MALNDSSNRHLQTVQSVRNHGGRDGDLPTLCSRFVTEPRGKRPHQFEPGDSDAGSAATGAVISA